MTTYPINSHMNFRMSLKERKIIETAEHDIEEMSQFNTLTLNDKEWKQFLVIMEPLYKSTRILRKQFSISIKLFE